MAPRQQNGRPIAFSRVFPILCGNPGRLVGNRSLSDIVEHPPAIGNAAPPSRGVTVTLNELDRQNGVGDVVGFQGHESLRIVERAREVAQLHACLHNGAINLRTLRRFWILLQKALKVTEKSGPIIRGAVYRPAEFLLFNCIGLRRASRPTLIRYTWGTLREGQSGKKQADQEGSEQASKGWAIGCHPIIVPGCVGNCRLTCERSARCQLDSSCVIGISVRVCERSGPADVDFARDRVHLNAARGRPYVSAKRMLRLLFQDHRQVGANVSRSSFGGEQEAGIRWHSDIYGTGNRLQFPEPAEGGISADVYASRDGMHLYVIRRSADFNCTARGGGIDPITRLADTDRAGGRVDLEVPFDLGDR